MTNDLEEKLTDNLVALVYKSTATRIITEDEINDLLKSARKRNKENKISGILVYYEGFFLQYLEGPEDNLKEIFELIKKDHRHTDIIQISYKSIKKKEFSDWNMAYSNKLVEFFEKFKWKNDVD